MFGFDPHYFKKIALTDSENRVEGMDWKPLELGCPQTADEKTSSLECSQVGTKARKKGQHVVGFGLRSRKDEWSLASIEKLC